MGSSQGEYSEEPFVEDAAGSESLLDEEALLDDTGSVAAAAQATKRPIGMSAPAAEQSSAAGESSLLGDSADIDYAASEASTSRPLNSNASHRQAPAVPDASESYALSEVSGSTVPPSKPAAVVKPKPPSISGSVQGDSLMASEIDYSESGKVTGASPAAPAPRRPTSRSSSLGSASASVSGKQAAAKAPAAAASASESFQEEDVEVDYEPSEQGDVAPAHRAPPSTQPSLAASHSQASAVSSRVSRAVSQARSSSVSAKGSSVGAGAGADVHSTASSAKASSSAGKAPQATSAAAEQSHDYDDVEYSQDSFRSSGVGGKTAQDRGSQQHPSAPPSVAASAAPSSNATPVFRPVAQHTPAESYAESFEEVGSTAQSQAFNRTASSTASSARPSASGSNGPQQGAANGQYTPMSQSGTIPSQATPQSLFRRVTSKPVDTVVRPKSAAPAPARQASTQQVPPQAQQPLPEDSWEGQIMPAPPLGARRPTSAAPRPMSSTYYPAPFGSSPAQQHHSHPPRPASVASSTASMSPSTAAAGGYASRPASAGPRDRQGAQLAGLTRRHPATWDARDVATWVEYIGLGQYRRKFLHNCIDGRLLLRLTDGQLKNEVGIAPMGHRAALLDAISALSQEAEANEDLQGDDGDGGVYDDHGDDGGGRRGSPSRVRPMSAAPGLGMSPGVRQEAVRRPASASPGVMPSDAYLGPALGKVTVYEQRAKLLFELDRAQARAAQRAALASQLAHNANLSEEEVAHIRGLLQDLERKHRAALAGAGSSRPSSAMDSRGRIPWSHVGSGTKLKNWNPERFAGPGDMPNVDLTFKPKISAASKRILSEGYGDGGGAGGNSFLDRLNNDQKKRERAKQELTRKYYSRDAQMGPGGAQQAFERDFAMLQDEFARQFNASLERDPESYESTIDQVFNSIDQSRLREAGVRVKPIEKASGQEKVALAAAAIRTMLFMDRYKSELRTRKNKEKELQDKWIRQTLGAQYLPGAKDATDLRQAGEFFCILGWRGDDGITEERLDALLRRARAYKEKYEAWWDRVRDKPQERALGFRCDVDWYSPPWSTSDDLNQLMEAENVRNAEANSAAGGSPAPSAVDSHRGPAEVIGGGPDYVLFTVRLLGRCRWDDLARLDAKTGQPKLLAVYRAVRTQKFIDFTQADQAERQRKLREMYEALAPQRRKLSTQQIDGFFERLLDDAGKRKEKIDKAMHDKMAKEQEILKSSVMYGRTRPKSAR